MRSGFLTFQERPQGERKTKIVDVISARHGNQLGVIGWHGAWRQYVFQPTAETIWSDGCLADVVAYLSTLRAERTRS